VILLVDANALVWSIEDPTQLSEGARRSIADPANEVLVSAATVWELAIKRASGKIRLPASLGEAVELLGFTGLPITIADGELAAALPPHHKDPFDRVLVAQAQRLDCVIVTRDRAFADYDVKVLTA
jgi:PIN domain nuclease of toxin-antitoxin system